MPAPVSIIALYSYIQRLSAIIFFNGAKMSEIFEFYVNEYPAYLYCNGLRFIELDPNGEECEAERKLNGFLDPYNKTIWSILSTSAFTSLIAGYWSWAEVLLPREYQLTGHILSLREDAQDIKFSNYTVDPKTIKRDGSSYLSVSTLSIRSKDVLRKYAEKSQMFKQLWEALNECDDDRHWILLADSLPKEWVEANEKEDRTLFKQHGDKIYKPPETKFPQPCEEEKKAFWRHVIENQSHISFGGE